MNCEKCKSEINENDEKTVYGKDGVPYCNSCGFHPTETKPRTKPNCAICGKKCFMDGISVPLLAVTESGMLEDVYNTESSSSNIIVPLCPYHMVIAGEGFIGSDGKSLIMNPDIDKIGNLPTEWIKETIKNIKSDRSVPFKVRKYNINLGETVLQAREFEEEMNKKVDNFKKEGNEK